MARVSMPESMKRLYSEPARLELLKRFTGGRDPTYADYVAVRRFLRALAETVGSRKRTVLKGLGVFEWKPWNRRIPTGRTVSSQHLFFALTRSKRNYAKGEPDGIH